MGYGEEFLIPGVGAFVTFIEKPSRALSRPMCRDLTDPRDAGIAKRDVGIEASGLEIPSSFT